MSQSIEGKGPFPALASSSLWRYFVFTMLYVAQGIPIGLLIYAMPNYLAYRGVEAAIIGSYLGLATLPHAIKLVIGPVMDRWTYLPMGRRRPWVIVAQTGIIISFASLIFIEDPLAQISLLMIGAFTVNAFVAFQDVSVDGMAVDILKPEEQSRAASLMFGGQALGASLTTAAGAWLMQGYGIGYASAVCSILVVFIIMLPLLTRERKGEKLFPWSPGKATAFEKGERAEGWKDIVFSLKNYTLMRTALIFALAMVIFSLARGLHLALVPIYFVQNLGWTDVQNSNLESLAGLIGAIVTMTIGGTLVHKIGRVNFFTIACIAMAGSALCVALVPLISDSVFLLQCYRILYSTLTTLATVSMIAVAMAVCGKKVAATQFAIYMALGNVGLSLGSTIIGPLRAAMSDSALFLAFAGLALLSLFILRAVDLHGHAVKLEGMDMVAN